MADQGDSKIKTHSILEDYEVKWNQKLGTGISGPVRPCKSRVTGQQFALKCLHNRPRAWREVNLQMRCSGHPHIVSIIDIYENEVQFPSEPKALPRLFVVMELMQGGELFDRIAQQKSFTEQQAAHYARQICLAIQRCHSLNIAHRDLKPENLLLKDNSEDSMIKLSDFGFAKEDDGSLTTPHFTPYYVAPQILEAQRHQAKDKMCMPKAGSYTYDKSCDMWSLGVILYIMLCGYPPFYSETPSKQITKTMKKKIMGGQYDFPAEDWRHISPFAKDLVKRLLCVDASERLTVEQVLEHGWMNEAPLTMLNSPAVMLDKNHIFETAQAHSAHLTSLRLPNRTIRLKPLGEANNPILNKRRQNSHGSERSSGSDHEPPPRKKLAAEPPNMAAVVRDMMSVCLDPSARNREDRLWRLSQLTRSVPAPVGRRDDQGAASAEFQRLLAVHLWNGHEFAPDVNFSQLAHDLSLLLPKLEISTAQPANESSQPTLANQHTSFSHNPAASAHDPSASSQTVSTSASNQPVAGASFVSAQALFQTNSSSRHLGAAVSRLVDQEVADVLECGLNPGSAPGSRPGSRQGSAPGSRGPTPVTGPFMSEQQPLEPQFTQAGGGGSAGSL